MATVFSLANAAPRTYGHRYWAEYCSSRSRKSLGGTGADSVSNPLRSLSKTTSLRLVRRCDFVVKSLSFADMAAEKGGSIVREVLDKPGRNKLDYGSDRSFYAFPRLVKHVDDKFLSTLTQLYRERLPAGGEVLDLMSSWVSHLPPEVKYKRVMGHGMNAAELMKNPRLDEFFIKDLNEDQKFEAADQSFDAVICTVSVQYLQQPEKVFAEIYRILRPGGVCIMSFSNRMFYDKAIAAWRENSMFGRVQLVRQYFSCVRGFTEPEVVKQLPEPSGKPSGPNLPGPLKFLGDLFQLMQKSGSDPFYAVISYRNVKPTK